MALEIPSAAKEVETNNEQPRTDNGHQLKNFETPGGFQYLHSDPPPKLNKCQDEEPSISSNTTDPDWKSQVGKKSNVKKPSNLNFTAQVYLQIEILKSTTSIQKALRY